MSGQLKIAWVFARKNNAYIVNRPDYKKRQICVLEESCFAQEGESIWPWWVEMPHAARNFCMQYCIILFHSKVIRMKNCVEEKLMSCNKSFRVFLQIPTYALAKK